MQWCLVHSSHGCTTGDCGHGRQQQALCSARHALLLLPAACCLPFDRRQQLLSSCYLEGMLFASKRWLGPGLNMAVLQRFCMGEAVLWHIYCT